MNTMKLLRPALLAAALAVGGPAWAQHHFHGHGGGGHGGGHFHPRVGFGVVIGGPFWPWYGWPPPYYYPPAVVTVPVAPPTYIEQGAPPTASSGYWYFCTNPRGYYPYVKACPGGWQQVVPQPPPQ